MLYGETIFVHTYLCSLSINARIVFPEELSGGADYVSEISGIQSVAWDDDVYLSHL